MPQLTYTPEQIKQFYERIKLSRAWCLGVESAGKVARGGEAFKFLTTLQRYALAHIPFENLELHYSRTQKIDIHPEVVFHKIVAQGSGRGGYCLENNTLFATVLRTLGFKVYSTAARINSAALPDGEFGNTSSYYGFGHMVNIVVIEGARYLVDIGFGAGGPVKPLALEDGKEVLNIRPSQHLRLRLGTIPENQSDTKLWILERNVQHGRGQWSPCYCFPDQTEFIYADFLSLNEFPSTNQKSFFKRKICVVRYLMSEDGGEVEGEVVLFEKQLHRRLLGKKEVVEVFFDEKSRILAFEKYFDIKLDVMQQSGIIGMCTAIDHQ